MSTIVVATRNRIGQLRLGLESLRRYEGKVPILVVDDSSGDGTREFLAENDWVHTHRLSRQGAYRKNPSAVLNIAHSEAWKLWPDDPIHLEQGGEVCHLTDCERHLSMACKPGVVAIATCYNGTPAELRALEGVIRRGDYEYGPDVEEAHPQTNGDVLSPAPVKAQGGREYYVYSGSWRRAPFLFLGAIHRDDFLAVGGYNEKRPSRNDEDLANRLIKRGVTFRFVAKAVAFHLRHDKS